MSSATSDAFLRQIDVLVTKRLQELKDTLRELSDFGSRLKTAEWNFTLRQEREAPLVLPDNIKPTVQQILTNGLTVDRSIVEPIEELERLYPDMSKSLKRKLFAMKHAVLTAHMIDLP